MLLDLPDEVLSMIASYDSQALSLCCRRLNNVSLSHQFHTLSFSPTVRGVTRAMSIAAELNKSIETALDPSFEQLDVFQQTALLAPYRRLKSVHDAVSHIDVSGAMTTLNLVSRRQEIPQHLLESLQELLDLCYLIRDSTPYPEVFARARRSANVKRMRANAAQALTFAHSMPLLVDPNNTDSAAAFILAAESLALCRISRAFMFFEKLRTVRFTDCINADVLIGAISENVTLDVVEMYESNIGRTSAVQPFPLIGWPTFKMPQEIVICSENVRYQTSTQFLSHLFLEAATVRYIEFQTALGFPSEFRYPSKICLPLVEELLVKEKGIYSEMEELNIVYPQTLDCPALYHFQGSYDLFSRLLDSQFSEITDLYLDQWIPFRDLCTVIGKCTQALVIMCRLSIEHEGLETEYLTQLFSILPKTIEEFGCQPPYPPLYKPVGTIEDSVSWIPKVDLPNLYVLHLRDFYIPNSFMPYEWTAEMRQKFQSLAKQMLTYFPNLEDFNHVSVGGFGIDSS